MYPAYAESSSSPQVDIQYSIDSNNVLTTNWKATFKNTSDDPLIIRDYVVDVGSLYPKNIDVVDSNGEKFPYTVIRLNGGRGIKVALEDYVVEKGNTYAITITYKISNIMQFKGFVKYLLLPGINVQDINVSSITVKFPASFGPIAFVSTDYQSTEEREYSEVTINYTKTEPIVIIIGSYQVFNVYLQAKLENTTTEAITYGLYLPVDSMSQEVEIRDLTPYPANSDIAVGYKFKCLYSVLPSNNTAVTFNGTVKVMLQSSQSQVNDRALLLDNIDQDLLEKIKQQINPQNNAIQKVYEYLTDRVEIDNSSTSLDINSMLQMLAGGKKLTISPIDANRLAVVLLRSVGVPSYLVVGILYPYYQDDATAVWYSWVAYYDSNGFEKIMDIPFYLQTGINSISLNLLDRIAFYYASYDKIENILWQDISDSVKLSLTTLNLQPSIEAYVRFNETELYSDQSFYGVVEVRNNGHNIVRNVEVLLDPESTNIFDVSIEYGDKMLFPGESLSIPVTLVPKSKLLDQEANVNIVIKAYDVHDNTSEKQQEIKLTIKRHIVYNVIGVAITLVVISLFILLGIYAYKLVKFIRKMTLKGTYNYITYKANLQVSKIKDFISHLRKPKNEA